MQVHVHLPRQSLCVWAENRVERENTGPGVCSTGWYVVRQELCSFSRKLQAHQAWKEIHFLCQSATYTS